MDVKKLCGLIEENKQELFELLCTFVKINSENYRNSGNEEEMARLVHKMCLELGMESDLYSPLDIEGFENHPDYLPGRSLENRYNVTARWVGENNEDSLMIMGHTDTVEFGDLKNWEFPPLSGEIKDGKIFGRGACDDKYALATALFLIKLLKDNGFNPKKNLLFSAYSDEEHGGSHGALAAVLKYPCPKIVNMDGRSEVWNVASGGQEAIYSYHVDGTVDSAYKAATAIPVVLDVIKKFAENRRKELSENRFYKGTIIPDTSLRYMNVQAGKYGTDLDTGEVFFTYYTDKSKEEIYAEFDALHNEICEKLKPMGIIGDGFKPRTRFFHYVYAEPDCEDILNLVAAGKEAVGKDIKVCGSCLSDLSVISKYGSSNAFAFGAGRDFSLKGGAHQPNEFIECDSLVEYAKIIGAYIIKTLGE